MIPLISECQLIWSNYRMNNKYTMNMLWSNKAIYYRFCVFPIVSVLICKCAQLNEYNRFYSTKITQINDLSRNVLYILCNTSDGYETIWIYKKKEDKTAKKRVFPRTTFFHLTFIHENFIIILLKTFFSAVESCVFSSWHWIFNEMSPTFPCEINDYFIRQTKAQR